jgi:hypothetical protein
MWENTAGHTFEIEIGTIGRRKEKKIRYLKPFGTAGDFARLPYDT